MSDAERVDDWQVHDPDSDNVRAFDTRPEADDAVTEMSELGIEVDVYPPGESPWDDTEADGGTVELSDDTSGDSDGDSGEMDNVDVIEHGSTGDDSQASVAGADRLPDDPNLTDDPFAWMPGDFVDTIEGKPTINRQGYAALAHKFDISAPTITVELGPEETGHEYCRVKATVEDSGGRRFVNHGSAHVDRGDDPTLLLELATTRARKRALAGATGVGLIAVEELKNEL